MSDPADHDRRGPRARARRRRRRSAPRRSRSTTRVDRVLAEDLTAAGDVPPFPCSAMDGYAVTPGPAGRTPAGRRRVARRHPVAHGRSATARRSGSPPAPRSPTGATAVIPPGERRAATATIVTRRDRARRATTSATPGEDMRAGTTVLRRGHACSAPPSWAPPSPPAPARLRVRPPPARQRALHRRRARGPGRAARPRRDPQLERRRCSSPWPRTRAPCAPPAQRLPDDRAATEAGAGARARDAPMW